MKVIKTRRFKHGAVNHVYQRTLNRFNIFYDLTDYLVYFTIFCTAVKRYNVAVYSLCLMIDHIHCLVSSSTKESLSRFISNVTSVFVREFNASIGRKGPLFEKRFGSAPKADRKKLVTSIIYLGNNPVEKKICQAAEQYRWNFLAYMSSRSPFSDPIIKHRASFELRRAIRQVDYNCSEGQYLNYVTLRRLMGKLSATEKNQLTDYIIATYNVIDYDKLLMLFESYEQLLTSMHSTTGSEYDIKETIEKSSDIAYRDMIKAIRAHNIQDVRGIIMYDIDDKIELARMLRHRTGVQVRQIAKFLHLHIENSSEQHTPKNANG